MPSLTTALAISAGSSVLGGGISALGALGASRTQAGATQQGIFTQIAEQENLAGLLGPYWGTGVSGVNQLGANIGALTTPFQPTMDQLSKTPGYQFTLNQGLQATANAYSGQGLGAGVSGGAMTPSGPGAKGAINYAENLASTTYQQQFQNYLAQNAQNFNMMMGQAQLGEQATAAWGGVAQNASNSISGLLSAGGAAQAAGTQSAANAVGQGISGAGGAVGNFALLNALGGGSLFGGGGGSVSGMNDAQLGNAVLGGFS